MKSSLREVLDVMFEFLLSMLLIVGSGYLLCIGVASELASGVVTLVVGYWFTSRSNATAVNNLLRQSPTLVPIANENHTTLPQTQQVVPATGQPITDTTQTLQP